MVRGYYPRWDCSFSNSVLAATVDSWGQEDREEWGGRLQGPPTSRIIYLGWGWGGVLWLVAAQKSCSHNDSPPGSSSLPLFLHSLLLQTPPRCLGTAHTFPALGGRPLTSRYTARHCSSFRTSFYRSALRKALPPSTPSPELLIPIAAEHRFE